MVGTMTQEALRNRFRPQQSRLTNLLEREMSPAARIDRAGGVIRDVQIISRHSLNGREYSDTALADAARLYEGCRVMVNHPDKSTPGRERAYEELFEELRGVRRVGDAVRGDLHFNRSHPLAEQICESAERFPRSFGLSHNADGEMAQRGGRNVVESIHTVRSVDLVCRPATNGGLFESVDGNGDELTADESEILRIVRGTGTISMKCQQISEILTKIEGAAIGSAKEVIESLGYKFTPPIPQFTSAADRAAFLRRG